MAIPVNLPISELDHILGELPTREEYEEFLMEHMCDGDNNSLIQLLDQKDRIIDTLRIQIRNQKMQLQHYLDTAVKSPPIFKLAKTCTKESVETNIQLSLAVDNFCKSTGLRNTIGHLQDRMQNIERRTLRLLDQQEQMVRENVEKLKFQRKDLNRIDFKSNLGEFVGYTMQVNVLTMILNGNGKLRKELETYRTCCDRLSVIHDERNYIVEKVYSIPVSTRLNYGVILSAEFDKQCLEGEVTELRREQKKLQNRLMLLSNLNCDHHLREKLKCTRSLMPEVSFLLQDMESDAGNLLKATEKYKDLQTRKMNDLIKENQQLTQDLHQLKYQKGSIAAGTLRLQKEFQSVAKELNNIKDELLEACENVSKYRSDNTDLMQENLELKRTLQHYKQVDAEVISLRNKVSQLKSIQEERDSLKHQLSDLETQGKLGQKLLDELAELRDCKRTYLKQIDRYKRLIANQDVHIKKLEKLCEKVNQSAGAEKNAVNKRETRIPTSKSMMSNKHHDHTAKAAKQSSNHSATLSASHSNTTTVSDWGSVRTPATKKKSRTRSKSPGDGNYSNENNIMKMDTKKESQSKDLNPENNSKVVTKKQEEKQAEVKEVPLVLNTKEDLGKVNSHNSVETTLNNRFFELNDASLNITLEQCIQQITESNEKTTKRSITFNPFISSFDGRQISLTKSIQDDREKITSFTTLSMPNSEKAIHSSNSDISDIDQRSSVKDVNNGSTMCANHWCELETKSQDDLLVEFDEQSNVVNSVKIIYDKTLMDA